MITAISSGFLIGLLGSFHCVGMCGPLALALPINTTNKIKRLFATSLYNLGRLTAYASIG
ncbi:MAG: sulfite exporter TauE/SafE family protein, partial [Romboutsia sp.]|nr:sulfite exporter TauE/SafE family protein [Romboutsia sp.]